MPVEIKGDEITITQGDRRYRVRGLGKNLSHELLKVNVLVSGTNLRGESGFHVDTLDLYSARQRTVFIKQASEELGIQEEIIRRDLGRVLFVGDPTHEALVEWAARHFRFTVLIGADSPVIDLVALERPDVIVYLVQERSLLMPA